MAESDFTTHSWTSMSTGPGTQGSELAAPLLSTHALMSAPPFPHHSHEASYGPIGNHSMSHPPDMSNDSFSSQVPGRSPYPLGGGHPIYYPPPHSTYHYPPTHPRLPPAFRNGTNEVRMSFGATPDTGDTMSRADQSMLHGSQPLHPFYYQGYGAPTNAVTGARPYPRRQHYPMMGFGGPPRYMNREALQATNAGTPEQSHHIQPPYRRASHHEHHSSSHRTYDSPERHSTLGHDSQGRRSDRSNSPRTSNRRSFDRYQFDLSQSSTSSDAEEAAARAPPSSRARHRPREVRPRFFGQHQHIDSNIATPRQIQELKDRLPRRLPSELQEKTSKACDICQKDYATEHVKAAEEEEVAIELPCGHCFGEFCIFEWFDTCKTHKNKVTCPMCRKQLIEPSRYHPAVLNAMSRHPQAFQELLANELRGDFSHM